MFLFDVNFLAIIVVVVVNLLLGAIWYSPYLFGPAWTKAHLFNVSDLKPTPFHYIGAAIVAFITAWVFSLIINWTEAITIAEGAFLGFFLWLGFVATTHFSGVLWAKKNIIAYLIDSGYQLVSLILMGILLTAWF